MLIAYDDAGEVVGTLDYLVRFRNGKAVSLVDFDAHDELTDVWTVEGATGSKTWPEWIGHQAHNFRVELDGPPGRKRIKALIHKRSGFVRERAAVEFRIGERIARAGDKPADIRDIVGGPGRALRLDAEGRSPAD